MNKQNNRIMDNAGFTNQHKRVANELIKKAFIDGQNNVLLNDERMPKDLSPSVSEQFKKLMIKQHLEQQVLFSKGDKS